MDLEKSGIDSALDKNNIHQLVEKYLFALPLIK